MRFLKSLGFLVVFSTLMFAQAVSSNVASAPGSSTVADQLKQLQDAMAAQQKQIAIQQQENMEQSSINGKEYKLAIGDARVTFLLSPEEQNPLDGG